MLAHRVCLCQPTPPPFLTFLLLASVPLCRKADASFRSAWSPKVGVGQKPKLEIHGLAEPPRVEVMLNRDDGKNVSQDLGR